MNSGAGTANATVPTFFPVTWRAAAAKEQGVPAYVIFHDATLRQIAALRPPSLDGLGTVSGVGEAKLARYGEPVLQVIKEFAELQELSADG